MIKNLRLGEAFIVESGKTFGHMNSNPKFYPQGWTLDQIKSDFLFRRCQLGNEFGFDGHKMFIADQKDKTGTYFVIEKDFVKAYEDGWDASIPQDILVMSDKVTETVIGEPLADCALVAAYDPRTRTAAIAHCSAELTDKRIPEATIEALRSVTDAKSEYILTYISACAGRGWTYDRHPRWAEHDDVWDGALVEENGIWHIDLRHAIEEQLLHKGILVSNMQISNIDTLTDPDFYSNSAAYNGDPTKSGRHFAGVFFKEKIKSR